MDAPKSPSTVLMPIEEANKYGVTFAKSRLFSKAAENTPVDVVPFKLAAIVMAGAELGFSPFASIAGISIVEGKPRLGYQLLGALIRRSGKYDYRVQTLTEDLAAIEFRQLSPDYERPNGALRWESLGVSTFSKDDAQTAGLLDRTKQGNLREPWHKYRRNMLFARAMSNGVNFFCPDVAAGVPIYADDENDKGEDRDEDEGRPLRQAVATAAPLAKTTPAIKTIDVKITKEHVDEFHKPEPAPGSLAKIDPTPAPKASGPLPEVARKIAEDRAVESPAAGFTIHRPDGTSTPLGHASAAVENARREDVEKKAAEIAKSNVKALETPATQPPADPNAMRSNGVCSSCKAEIWWGVTATGATCPYNADGVSHFATCPNAAEHSGAGKEKRKRRTKEEIAADKAKEAAEKEAKAKALAAKAEEPTSTAPDPFQTGVIAPDEPAKTDAPIAKALGLEPGESPLAPDAAPGSSSSTETPSSTAPANDPVPGPTAAEPEAHDVPEEAKAAFTLLDEIRAVPDNQEVSGKQASAVHVAGINFYGSDENARKAWVAISYSLPKRGEKITKKPTGFQAYKYLTLILEKAAERSAAATPTDES